MTRKKSSSTGKGPSQRMLRIGEMVRHKLSELLIRGEIHDDVLASHVISISEVRISSDLKLATAYVLPLGGKDTAAVLAALDEVSRIDRLLYSDKVRRDVEKK
jgi:ribosome-binding factor A